MGKLSHVCVNLTDGKLDAELTGDAVPRWVGECIRDHYLLRGREEVTRGCRLEGEYHFIGIICCSWFNPSYLYFSHPRQNGYQNVLGAVNYHRWSSVNYSKMRV